MSHYQPVAWVVYTYEYARPSDCEFLSFNSWRTWLLPCLKTGVSAA